LGGNGWRQLGQRLESVAAPEGPLVANRLPELGWQIWNEFYEEDYVHQSILCHEMFFAAFSDRCLVQLCARPIEKQ
jgi:hypothetical protein